MDRPAPDVTGLLAAARAGDRSALDRLVPIVYDELRRLAHRQLAGRDRGGALRTTGLVHEAYLRLIEQREPGHDRAHFFAVAATLMRRVLVDHVRAERAGKRGGGAATLALDDVAVAAPEAAIDVLLLDAALDRLEALDATQARIVELRYFSGLTIEDTASALEISPATVKREWAMARAFLLRELGGAPG